MDKKEAIRLVYGDKAVEDYDKYEYKLPSELARDKPEGCEVWYQTQQTWEIADDNVMFALDIYRWPKQQKRWWFNEQTKSVYQAEKLAEMPTHIIEVSEIYAKYLQNKPADAECELRMVKEGDVHLDSFVRNWFTAHVDLGDMGVRHRGWGWVKTESACKIVPVVDGMCNGNLLMLGFHSGIEDHRQAGYIYSNGQESPHSWLWADSTGKDDYLATRRTDMYCKPVTPVKVVCAKRGATK
jgi:hypothetical protein